MGLNTIFRGQFRVFRGFQDGFRGFQGKSGVGIPVVPTVLALAVSKKKATAYSFSLITFRLLI
jgi:hypothetical protein